MSIRLRALFFLVSLAAPALLAACGGDGEARARRFLSIGTGGTGGVYYPLGGALANRLSLRDPGRQYTAEVTGGAVENANRLRNGQIDLGFVLAITLVEAYEGTGDYSTPDPGLRVVAPLYPNLHHVVVSGSSRARSVADLRGARISVGSPGSGTEQLARQLLEVYGLGYEDISVRYLSFTESAQALRDGSIDAAIISAGYPAAAVLEATTTGGARLLPIEAERVQALVDAHSFYRAYDLPVGVYPGVDQPVPTVGLLTWIVVRDSLADEVVTALLDILEDERAALEQVHPIASQIDLGVLRSAPVPLHPAAERWLEARGR